MAAKRMLRDWTDSQTIDQLSAEAERFLTRFIMKADDRGLFTSDPILLRAALFPRKLNISPEDVLTWVGECLEAINEKNEPLMVKFKAEEDGKDYLILMNFGQRLTYERQFKISIPREFPGISGKNLKVSGGREEKRRENEVEIETEENYILRMSLIKRIVECLNKVTGSSYKHQSVKTQGFITARLREKFEYQDFETVIIHKTAEWGEDKKMQNFLRPETIFGNKFEGYLQAAKREKRTHIISKTDQLKKSIAEEIANELTANNNQ